MTTSESINSSEAAYLALLRDVREHGRRGPTRAILESTGERVDALGVFGRQVRYDLAAGFPLLTTKRVNFDAIVHELVWFLSGSTNIGYLREHGVRIWDQWADEDGELGPAYGRQFRRVESSAWVEPKVFDGTPEPYDPGFSREIEVDWSIHNTALLGREIGTPSGPATVIREVPPEPPHSRTRLEVKFHRTGAVRIASYDDVDKESVKDLWAPSVYGVGSYGEYDERDPDYTMLVSVWRGVIRRCYDESFAGFKSYGAKGVHVDPRWKVFAFFQEDAKSLPGWSLKEEHPDEYSLDKDTLWASNRYGPRTCLWASHEEQSVNTSTGTPFTAISPDGDERLFLSLGQSQREHGLSLSAVHRCLNGKLKSHKGWSGFRYIARDGHVLRTRIIDQVRNVVASIKHDPPSRRHVISLWNVAEIDRMALPPCHGISIQFHVEGGRLSCMVYQRSLDCFIGAPFNVASYALLTHLLAHAAGLQTGELIHSIGDAHIYANHLDQVDEQLSREPGPAPGLALGPLAIGGGIATVDAFRREHARLIGYDPHPALKGEVAV